MKQEFKIKNELLQKVIEITDVDYTGTLELKDIENIIKDLITEYHKKEEELEDLKENVKENYEPIPYWKQIL